MFRKTLVYAVAAFLTGAGALGAEGSLAPSLEVGLDLGGSRVGVAGADWSTASFSPRLQASRSGEGINYGFRIRGLFTADSDFSEDGVDATGEASGFLVNGYAGWGFDLGAGWSLSVVGGLGFRNIDAGYTADDVDMEYDVSASALTLDLGLGLRGEINEQLVWTTSLMFGPVVVGDVDADVRWGILNYSSTEDVEAGFFAEVRTGLDVKLRDGLGLNLGLVFEAFGVDVDVESDDELEGLAYYTFAFSFGVTWKF